MDPDGNRTEHSVPQTSAGLTALAKARCIARENKKEGVRDLVRAVYPRLAILLAVFGFNMLGNVIRDVLDPKLRTR